METNEQLHFTILQMLAEIIYGKQIIDSPKKEILDGYYDSIWREMIDGSVDLDSQPQKDMDKAKGLVGS